MNAPDTTDVSIAAGSNIGTAYTDKQPITPKVITPAKTNLGDVMQGNRWASDAVNWFYKEVIGQFFDTGGKDLYDLLIEPISGDFNRIKANGDAWKDVGDLFWKMGGNISENAADLTKSDWTGSAATAFFQQMNVVWTSAFLTIQGVCGLLQKGFNAIGDVSIKIATKCANLLNTVLNEIAKLAVKAIPVVGWLGSLVEFVASDFKDFPYVSDINAIITLIKDAIALQQLIKTLVDTGQKVYQGLSQALDAIKQLPTVDTTAQAIDIVEGFKQGVDQTKKNATEFNKTQGDIQKQIDSMNSIGGK